MSETATSQITLKFGVDGLSQLENQIKSAISSLTDLDKIQSTAQATAVSLGNAFNNLQNEFKDTAKATATVGKNISSSLSQGIQLAGNNIKTGVKGIGSTFKGLVTTAQATGKAVTVGLGAIGLALNGVTAIVNLLTRTFSSLDNVKGVGALNKDIKGLTDNLKQAVEFVSKVVAVLAAPAVSVFASAIENIKKVFSDAGVVEKFATAIGFVQTAFAVLQDHLKNVYTAWQSFLAPILSAGAELFGKVKDAVVDFNNNFSIIETTVGVVKIALDTVLSSLGSIGAAIGHLIKGEWSEAMASAKDTVAGVGAGIKQAFTESTEVGRQAIQSFTDSVKVNGATALENIKNATVQSASQMKSGVSLTLAEQIKRLQEYTKLEKDIISATEKDEKVKNEKLLALDKQYLSQKLSLEKSAYKTIVDNNGKIEDKSISSLESLKKQIIETQKEYDNFGKKAGKVNKDFQSQANQIVSIVSGMASSVISFASTILGTLNNDLSEYDKAIEEVTAKWDAILEEFDAKQSDREEATKEQEASDREERIALLEEELERSLKAEDQMSAKAIKIKLDALKKEQAAEEKKNAEEKAASEERTKLEKQQAYEISLAQYNKDLAEYNNTVKKAEQEKALAIADASVKIGQAVAQSVIIPLVATTQLGPIAGPIVGLTLAASLLGAALSGIGGIVSASSNLDQAKASAPTPPTPPALAHGTGGLNLADAGGYAIVGEAGAELVRQKSNGDLEVIGTERTKGYDIGRGDTINLNVYVNEMISEETLVDFLNNIKRRNLNFAI